MAVSPPFNIDTSSPAASDNISAYPANEQANRDIIASWLAFISDPATGLIKSAALPTELELENLTVTGDILMPTGGSAIHPGTEDGSDNGYVTLSGGGDGGGVSRGAYFRAFGNETSVTPGNAYVVAGATGTVQLVGDTTITGTLNVTGMTTAASFKSTQNYVGGGNVVLSPNAAGTVYLRPNGAASGTGQTTIASTGAMSVGGAIVAAGNITANNAFATPGATHILATGTAGTIYMRPNGAGSATGQATLGSGGTFTAPAFAGNGAAITGLTSGQITGALGYTPVDKAGDTMTGLLTLSGDPTSNLHAATKQYVDSEVAGGAIFTKSYESPEQAITIAGTLTINHDLGEKPKLTTAVLVCKTAETINGTAFAVGDEIAYWPGFHTDSGNSRGASIKANATQFVVQYSNQAGNTFQVISVSGGIITLTNDNWRLVIRAYA